MKYRLIDKKYGFISIFDTETGAYLRTGILDKNGKDTGVDLKLKSLMGIDNATNEDVYVDGYFRTSEYFSTESGKEQSCWLILPWDSSINTLLNVVPVSGDQKLVAELTKVIKEKLSGLELPVRGTLNYSKDYSKEDIKLSDNLYCSMLSFR